MAQTKYTCKDCVLFNDDEPDLPFCMGKDLYTHAGPDDDACGDIIPLVYTCKDCFFFKDGVCHHPTVNMFTSEGDPSCKHFEYKEIKVEL